MDEISKKLIYPMENKIRFFKALQNSKKLEIKETVNEGHPAYSCNVLNIHATVKEPFMLDDGRLKFKEGDYIEFTVTTDEDSSLGLTSVSQKYVYADGRSEWVEYGYIDLGLIIE